jgi:hypothetical protein
VEPNGLDLYLVQILMRPGRLPAQLSVTYPMREQADQLAKTIQDVATRPGVAQFVQVTHQAWDPDPQRRGTGEWRSVGRSAITEVQIGPRPTASISRGPAPDSGEIQRWSSAGRLWNDRGIFIKYNRETYRGYINAEGNLVLAIANEPVTFKKVE